MLKRKLLFTIFLLWLATFQAVSANNQKDWTNVESCRVLSSHLKTLIANNDLNENLPELIEEEYFIDDWELKASSSTYFVDYQKSTNVVTVIKGPRDPQGGSVDFNASTKIGSIKLPKDFTNVQIRFFKEETMLLFAEHYDSNSRVESVILFYDLADDKLTASHYYANTWRLVKINIQNGKLYMITNAELTKNMIQRFIKKDGDLPSIFPKFSEGLKYGLITNEKTSVCKNYKYLYKPSDQMPSFRNIMVLNLNNLNNTKEFMYYIGTLSQFKFSEKSMYLSIKWDNDTTIVQKFWLEPKLNMQSSEILSWTLLDWGILIDGLKSAFVTVQSSWKLRVYTLTSFNSNFKIEESVELYSWSDRAYNAVEYGGTTVFLKDQDTAIAVDEWTKDWNYPSAPIELPLDGHKYFMVSWDPLILLQTEEKNNKIYFTLIEKNNPQKAFRNLYKASYISEWRFLGNFSWDIEKQTLAFTTKLTSVDGDDFQGIRIIQIPNNGKIKEIMARKYEDVSFSELETFKEFTYAITNKLIDIFIPTSSSLLKVMAK